MPSKPVGVVEIRIRPAGVRGHRDGIHLRVGTVVHGFRLAGDVEIKKEELTGNGIQNLHLLSRGGI